MQPPKQYGTELDFSRSSAKGNHSTLTLKVVAFVFFFFVVFFLEILNLPELDRLFEKRVQAENCIEQMHRRLAENWNRDQQLRRKTFDCGSPNDLTRQDSRLRSDRRSQVVAAKFEAYGIEKAFVEQRKEDYKMPKTKGRFLLGTVDNLRKRRIQNLRQNLIQEYAAETASDFMLIDLAASNYARFATRLETDCLWLAHDHVLETFEVAVGGCNHTFTPAKTNY